MEETRVKDWRSQYDPKAAKARLSADVRRVEKISNLIPLSRPKINTFVEMRQDIGPRNEACAEGRHLGCDSSGSMQVGDCGCKCHISRISP